VKIRIGSGEPTSRDWTGLDLSSVLNGLPETDQHVERIYVDRAFEQLDSELLPHVLAAWRDHAGVTIRTVMGVVGYDVARARRLLASGQITPAEFERARAATGPCKNSGVNLYESLRSASWGCALPYDINLLVLDNWPISDLSPWQFGALCRPLK
jgi:hypothetical protein